MFICLGVVTIQQAKKGIAPQRKKTSKLDKYLCFVIYSHGNHGKLLFFHSYECQGIQIKNPFDQFFNLILDLGPLKVNI